MGAEVTLGTFCRENGHMLCDYPDLYAYGHESSGVGIYCLMCAGTVNEKIFFPSRRRHTRSLCDWSSDVCSSDLSSCGRSLVPSSIGLFVMMVLFVLLTKDRPQELGLAPLGEASMPPVPPRPTGNFVLLSLKALRLGSEQLVFWVLAATFFICGLSSYGLTQTHFVPYCGDLGFPLVTSASLLAMIGVCDLIGTIGSGWLSDRYDNRWLLAIYYGLRGVSLVWLVTSNVSLVAMIAFTVIYGLDFIATVPPTVRLTVAAFGREMGPAVFGWIFAAHQLGVGFMAVWAGVNRIWLGHH